MKTVARRCTQPGLMALLAVGIGCGGDTQPKTPNQGVDLGSISDIGVVLDGGIPSDAAQAAGDEGIAPPPRRVAEANELDRVALFTCDTPTPSSSPARIRRIEREEYAVSASRPLRTEVFALRNSVSHQNPFETPGFLPYSTYSENVGIDETTLGLLFGVLQDSGLPWRSTSRQGDATLWHFSGENPQREIYYCTAEPGIPDPETCVEPYLSLLLSLGVLHRAYTPGEFERLSDFAMTTFAEEPDPIPPVPMCQEDTDCGPGIACLGQCERGTGLRCNDASGRCCPGGQPCADGPSCDYRCDIPTPREESLSLIASAAHLMAGAMFRSEIGEGMAEPDGRRRLSDDELRVALGYFLSDAAPGTPGARFSWDRNTRYTAGENGHLGDILTANPIFDPTPGGTIERLVEQYAVGSESPRVDLALDYDFERLTRRGRFWTGDKIRRFFQQWLDYHHLGSVFKDTPHETSTFDDVAEYNPRDLEQSYLGIQGLRGTLESNLVEQLDDLIARLIAETDADQNRSFFAELLTTRMAYVPATRCVAGVDPQSCPDRDRAGRETQRVYNLRNHVLYDPEDPETRWVELPEGERAGVLTHPAWLAAHGGNFEDDGSVIHRGKWILENLLCEVPPSLEGLSIQAQLIPREDPRNTNARERLDESLKQSEADIEAGAIRCTDCHNMMNPLGYPFEMYNHAGFLRDPNHERTPDFSSRLTELVRDPSLRGDYANAIELTTALSTNTEVRRCFMRNVFRFFMGRNETLDDACTLVRMENAYTESGGSFTAILKALATSDTFLYRHDAVEAQ